MIGVALGASAVLAPAYPGDPTGWDWRYYENSQFVPEQISACTDPDGRLRTLFIDSGPIRSYADPGQTPVRVCRAVMESFRVYATGLGALSAGPNGEFIAANLGDPFANPGTDDDVSYNATLQLRRTSVYAVAGPENTLSIGGSYLRMLPGETFADNFFPSQGYDGPFIPLAGRPVLTSLFAEFPYGFGGQQYDALATTAAPGSIRNSATLSAKFGPGGENYLRLRYSELDPVRTTNPYNTLRLDLKDLGAPAGWAVDRVITGGSLAITSDRRDIYAFVTSYVVLAEGIINPEARVFRVRTNGVAALVPNEGDYEYGIEQVNSVRVSQNVLAAGTPVSQLMRYPQILLSSTNEPRWVVWQDVTSVKWNERVPFTGGTATENTRSIVNNFSVSGTRGPAAAPSAGLDRLDRLHIVCRAGTNDNEPLYLRQGGSVALIAKNLGGVCSGAPAMTVGPGGYPYVVFKGRAPGGSGADKLVIAYPQEVASLYPGDYEDRDRDGTIGLLETAQGSSDLTPNPPPLLTPAIITHTDDLPHMRLLHTVNASAVRAATGAAFTLPHLGDTIRIEPQWTLGLNTWNTSSFGVPNPAEPAQPGSQPSKQVYSLDTSPTTIGPKQFYRIKVTRIPGPP